MGSVDYIHDTQTKTKKVSPYDKEFIVAKLKLISASLISINFKPSEPALHLNKLIQAHDPAYQITPKIETTSSVTNLNGTHATRVHNHDYYLSPALRSQITNTICNFNNLKYAYPASQMPINTTR